MVKAWAVLLPLLAWCSYPVRGIAQAQPDPTVFKIDGSFVSVPLVLETKTEIAPQEIAAEQFRLWDNDTVQKTVVLRTDDLPVSLVVLMQTGDDASQYFKNYRELPSLLNQLLGGSTHEVTLVTFDSKIEQIWHFPARSDGVKNALRYPSRGDEGAAIRDAVHFGVEQLQGEPGRFRRIVLLLSAKADKGSTCTPRALLEQLGTASTVVYSVVFPSSKSKRERSGDGEKSGSVCERCSALPDAIRALDTDTATQVASMTGGSFLGFKDRQSFSAAMLEIGSQIHHGYTLGFSPDSPVPGLHLIRVEMKSAHSRSQVHARSLYWVRPENEESTP
jgi:hypothetical protein